MSKPLPERPDLGQLKKQAKDLLNEIRSGNDAAFQRAKLRPAGDPGFALHDAQRVIAQEHGFESWAKLKLHVETRNADVAEARLIEAILDGNAPAAQAILAEHPAWSVQRLAVAASLGEGEPVAAALRRNPAAATTPTGPRNWPPLLYLCFGRCGQGDAPRARIAHLLIEHGADVNVSWIHPDWPAAPLPALYGATGVNNYPQLARVLLTAGANPNDGESRYHAAEHNHVASLEVLAEFGTDFSGADKSWGNTPLFFLFGYAHPSDSVRAGIRWLLQHQADPNVRSDVNGASETALHAAVRNNWDAATLELLLAHGADPALRRADGRTAPALAAVLGRDKLLAIFAAHGSPAELAPADALLLACMLGDIANARALLRDNPNAIELLSNEDRTHAVVIAAREGRATAIDALHAVGIDTRAPDHDGATPLHWAAWHGQAEAVRTLLAHGAAKDARDRRFNAPPIGWCAHGSQFCRNPQGNYAAVAEALIAAGTVVPPDTTASEEVMAVLRKHGRIGEKAGPNPR